MVISTNKLKPPPSTEAVAWRKITAAGQLGRYAPEAIIAAFQDAGGRDRRLREGMARYLSDLVQRHLRKRVGTNKMDGGRDIIDDVQDEFFAAICDPACADAKGYRKSFYGRLTFRLKDAIANEEKAGVTASAEENDKKKENRKAKEPPVDAPAGYGAAADDKAAGETTWETESDESAANALFEGEEFAADGGVKRPAPALLANVDELLEMIDVERVLAQIPDYRKRLAFRLYMERVPYGGTKGTTSIAGAFDIDRKTAEHWVAEVRAFLLEHVPDVHALKRRAAGE